MKLKNLRICLTENKIFFETIAALLLSIMAVVVGYAQWEVSLAQKEIAKNQLDIDLKAKQPIFVFNLERTEGSESLTVENVGHHAKEFDFRTVVIVDYYLEETENQDNESEGEIDLLGYYTNQVTSSRTNGIVYEISGGTNRNRLDNIMSNISVKFEEEGWDFSWWNTRYIQIRYLDVFDKEHTKYYRIGDRGVSRNIWSGMTDRYFGRLYSKGFNEGTIDFEESEINQSLIIEFIRKNIQNEKS